MVDESYAQSKCPYHRALYWLVTRWVELLAVLTLITLSLTLVLRV